VDEPYIALMDTEKAVQTLFYLPSHFCCIEHPSILLERGVHKPSPAEYLAPFHQDPTQRIVVLDMPFSSVGYLVFRLEELLRRVEGREGCEIEWDEWKDCVAIPTIPQPDRARVWVSGSRLFSVTPTSRYEPDARMEVYDFTMNGRARYLSEEINADIGGVRYLLPTEAGASLQWKAEGLIDANGGHDSAVFMRVSDLLFSWAMRLNDMSQFAPQIPDDDSETEKGVLHIWNF